MEEGAAPGRGQDTPKRFLTWNAARAVRVKGACYIGENDPFNPDHQLEAEMRKLAKTRARREVDGVLGFVPIPEVLEFLRSPAKFRVLRGANRSGKTQVAAFEFARHARGLQVDRDYRPLPMPHRGKLELLCVGLDYTQIGEVIYPKLFGPAPYSKWQFSCPKCGTRNFQPATRIATSVIMLPREKNGDIPAWEGYVKCSECDFTQKTADSPSAWRWDAPPLIPDREIQKIAWLDKGKNVPAYVETACARINFLSAASGREHFQGARWHLVWPDEELGDDSTGVWSEILRGTMDWGGGIIWSATPLARQDALIDLHDRAILKDPEVSETVIGLAHNHHISLKDRESVARSWPRDQWKCRIKGEFYALEGLVYPEFNPAHVVQPWDIHKPDNAKHFTWYRSIDPGLGTTAVLWFAVDSDGNYCITDELYLKGSNLAELVKGIRETDQGLVIDDTTIDPSDQKTLTCPEGLRVVLSRDYQIPCHSRFSRAVEQGIFRCKEDLVKKPGAARAKFTVFATCTSFIKELSVYRRGEDKASADKSDAVVKRRDHGPDAWRYRCMSGLQHRAVRQIQPDGMNAAMRHYYKYFGNKNALNGMRVAL